MFQNQSGASRSATLGGSQRLQNGKLGSGSSWNLSFPMNNGATGLSNTQSRTNAGLSSFAQTIGGGQNQAPPDLSEFPSLSGGPQPQQQSSSAQIWGSNPGVRQQHTPVQRPQGQGQSQLQQHSQQHQSRSHDESAFPSGGDDYRFGGQGGVGQLSGLSQQPQTGNIEEFPPLGGLGSTEIGQDRRAAMMQNAAYGGQNGVGFGGALPQSGSSSLMGPDSQRDRTTQSAVGDSRAAAQDGRSRTNTNQFPNPPDHQAAQAAFRNTQQPSIGQHPDDHPFGGDLRDSPTAVPQPRHKRLSEMTESERFGLPGLLAMIPTESPDHSALAVGQDLTVLGLDLNRPDNSPLYPTFGTPFVDANARPVVPDFSLPPAYTVNNVPPLHVKMSSFSDETLFAIFYQFARDMNQELAAIELYNRDWRWHKKLRQWMMKDTGFGQPLRLNEREERGWYVFFDVNNWRRERREFLLSYEDLDHRQGLMQPPAAVGGAL